MAKKRSVHGLGALQAEAMEIVWDLGEGTVREVTNAMPARRRADFTTVQTYLTRLESKGYLRARKEGRAKKFRAGVRPRVVIREAVEDFVNRLFGGESLPLLKHLVTDRDISEDDLEQLRRLLDELPEE